MMDITAILHMHAELSLTAVFILMFLLDLFLPAPQRHWLRPMACILLTIQLLANLWPEEVTLFGGMYHSTPMASVLKSILTIGTILVFLQADTWLKREDTRHKQGEFYILTLSTLLGMYFMVSAGHFLLFFLGLELATVPMACLVAFDKYKVENRLVYHSDSKVPELGFCTVRPDRARFALRNGLPYPPWLDGSGFSLTLAMPLSTCFCSALPSLRMSFAASSSHSTRQLTPSPGSACPRCPLRSGQARPSGRRWGWSPGHCCPRCVFPRGGRPPCPQDDREGPDSR